MSNTSNRIKGAAEEATGSVKKAAGRVLDRPDLEEEGEDDQAVGRARQELAKAAERVKGKIEEVTGAVLGGVGDLLDNGKAHLKGKGTELKGKARQGANR